ncbi:VOC family protein [Paraburkholderia sp. HP33-1]|uniref:VOC family protein n=1 Tax=Paraburkholderia sp. HP33-1 TaxID=2883243 RepID=UPI001F2F02A8|nr:VOC family protein [Paraburkholderia sp. HP33-1]
MTTLTTPQPARHAQPTVHATGLLYLMFERPDLAKAEAFLQDFGLATASRTKDRLFMRGTGAAPFCWMATRGKRARFVGFGLQVASLDALHELSLLDGASAVEPLDASFPGGGQVVRLTDPSGFTVHAVFGQAAVEPLAHRPPLPMNCGDAQPPRINATQRPPAEPPEIIRLGHVVLEVARFQATCEWYTRHFGFIPSDVQVLPDGSPAVVFMRVDLGDQPADHHTLALAQAPVAQYSHSAYEVIDTDAVAMGQRVLRTRGHRHAWGIGRHILGSQIFDYWSDPWGHKHEHYTDGDLFTADHPMGVHAAAREAMSQWGPVMPASFSRPTLSPRAITTMIANVARVPDLTLGKLIVLARLFA